MSSSKDQLTGYLTVVAVPDLGHCGGLLIVNRLGRPIEFHCTSPVAENKTQKVLYGNTYHAFLYADQIGRALLKKVKRQPDLLVVWQRELVGLQDLMDIPVATLAVGDCNDFDDCSEMNESDQARGNSIESRVRRKRSGGETFFFSGSAALNGSGYWRPCPRPFRLASLLSGWSRRSPKRWRLRNRSATRSRRRD